MSDTSRTQRIAVPGVDQVAAFRVLEAFDHHAAEDIRMDVRSRVGRALQQFPVLADETVTIACRAEWDDRLGRADMRNRLIYLPTDRRSSFVTVYHELGHLAVQIRDEQGDDVPPTSERFTSLYAMARQPVAHFDQERVPYFPDPSIPTAQWPDVCAAALRYRERHHDYCQQAIRWFQGDEPLPSEGGEDGA